MGNQNLINLHILDFERGISMKKFYTKVFILTLSTALISTAIFCAVFFGIQGTYENSYQKGYVYQYRALQNADRDIPKIIVIGGSYMTFAIDLEQLREEIEMPVYTLGVHSGMGMSYIIETAKKYINAGDIVVFAFSEYDVESYGMDLIYLSMDGEPDMFWEFFREHPLEIIKAAGAEVYTKIYGVQNYLRWKDKGIQSVYDARAFDIETGNLIYERPECIATEDSLYGKDTYRIDERSDSCIADVNKFNEFCENNFANLFMMYAPKFEGSVVSTKNDIIAYQEALESKIQAPFLCDIADVLVPLDYIYDGPMHLNDVGKEYYTHKVYEGLLECRKSD